MGISFLHCVQMIILKESSLIQFSFIIIQLLSLFTYFFTIEVKLITFGKSKYIPKKEE